VVHTASKVAALMAAEGDGAAFNGAAFDAAAFDGAGFDVAVSVALLDIVAGAVGARSPGAQCAMDSAATTMASEGTQGVME
jgi:hypothetical protein